MTTSACSCAASVNANHLLTRDEARRIANQHRQLRPVATGTCAKMDALPERAYHYWPGAVGVAPRSAAAAAYEDRTSSARSWRTKAYPFQLIHARAFSSTGPASRLAWQRAMSVLPCCSSPGSSAIFRPSVLTQAISGLLVAQPKSVSSATIITRANGKRRPWAMARCSTIAP